MQDLLNRALEQHADQPASAAQTLDEALRGAAGASEADLLELLRVAEHVLLGHLADPAALRALLAQLPPHAGLEPARQRAEAALRLAAGEPPPDWHDLPPAERVRAHYNAALARTRSGDFGAAARLIELAKAQAVAGDAASQKALAALANNIAGDLRYYHRGSSAGDSDEARDELMLDAARLARERWALAGGWLEIERAEWQLARCAAAAGQATLALHHAQACLRLCEQHGADAFEHFFAHDAIARAHRAATQAGPAAEARARMAALLLQVPESDQDYARRALAELDAALAD
jgi:hypothetical protein